MSRDFPPFPLGPIISVLFAVAVTASAWWVTAAIGERWALWWSARDWPPTECEISRQADDAAGFQYAFEHDGRRYVASSIGIADRPLAELIALDAPVGTKLSCWVDPTNPAHSLLDRDFEAGVWLPGLWLVAAILLLTALRGVRSIGRWLFFRPRPPLTWAEWFASFYRDGAWKMSGVGGVFLAFGMTLTWGLTVLPWYNWWRAQAWPESTCVMVEGKVRYSRGGQFLSRGGYVMDAAFAYQSAGRQYVSHTYSPWRGGPIDWLIGPPRLVENGRIIETDPKLALGTSHRCYVSAADPRNAYIERRWYDGWYAIGTIGPGMALFGLLIVMARSRGDVRGKSVL